MKTKSIPAFLITLTTFGLALASVHFGLAQTITPVTGIITSNTTWTKANSPYSLTGPTAVNVGVTLTIEPGVTVKLNSYYIQVNGTLTAVGTSSDPINISGGSATNVNNPFGPFTPAGITFYPSSANWSEQTGAGCVIEHAIFNLTQITIYGSPKIANTSGLGLLIDAGSPLILNNSHLSILEYGGKPTISSNTMDWGIAVYGGSPTITNNIIKGGGNWGIALGVRYPLDQTDVSFVSGNIISGVYSQCIVATGTATIQQNLIITSSTTYYSSTGIAVGGPQSNVTIQNNTVVGSSIGIDIENNVAELNVLDNNFENTSQYYVYSHASNNLNVAYNWWGTTNESAINQLIYDSKNDFNLGTVNFVPLLTSPNSQAPAIPITTPTPTPTPTPIQTPTATSSATPIQSQSSTPKSTPSPSIPEFPSWIILSIAAVATLMVVIKVRIKKKNRLVSK